MRFLLRLLEFDDELQRKIYTGLLNEKALFDLVQLDQEDRSSMVSVFESLQMGGNKQKRLLSLCRDITQREDISVGTLLAHPEIKTVIDHRGMNIPQKVNRLFSQLQKRAYPQSTTAQDFFLAQVQGLDLPASCTITPAPFFERDEVSLTVRFSNFEECRKYCLQIKDLLR
ncbi:MAG: hypothetical protein P4L42_02800 [Desulfocapsaceae bacterium]|nr:hypothetical protein [Desulfocapsaceae bacterium]